MSVWRWLSEHLVEDQGEGIGRAETSWPINSPLIQKAAAVLPSSIATVGLIPAARDKPLNSAY